MRRLDGTNLDEKFRLLDTGAGARRFREDGVEHSSPLDGYLVYCGSCGVLIQPRHEGRPPLYCSSRCRKRAYRAKSGTS